MPDRTVTHEEAVAAVERLDDDGYPTEAALQLLREWPIEDAKGWLEFARSLWWTPEWGWPQLEGEVSTGGWSGNESVVSAMQGAHHGILWHSVWWSTRKGGHYTISLTRPVEPPAVSPDSARLARVEVIDHRSDNAAHQGRGRIYVAYPCKVELGYQDNGRTLKVFVDDAARTAAKPPTGETR